MKVLFAVNNDNVSNAIIKKYQKLYKEIITHKNVYYFNAIIKELQNDKTYDRVVISEDLEPFANNNYDTIDKFLFEKLDRISDEATKANGDSIDIVLICSDRRRLADEMLTKIFGIGIYNALIEEDRNLDMLCRLLNQPRTKKEAKIAYKIVGSNVGYQAEDENNVSEAEVQNILAHYKRLGKDEDKYVDSFNNIVSQYTDSQLRIIIRYLPLNVKAVLEERSPKYQELASFIGDVGKRVSKTPYTPRVAKDTKKEEKIKVKMLQDEKDRISKPIVIPSALNNKKKIISKPKEVTDTKMTKVMQPLAEQAKQTIMENDEEMENSNENVEPKRRRGRPRKNPPTIQPTNSVKRGRGRPRKIVEEIQEEKLHDDELPDEAITTTDEDIDLFSIDSPEFNNYNEAETNEIESNEIIDQNDDFDLFSLDENDSENENSIEDNIESESYNQEENDEEYNLFDLDDEDEEEKEQEIDVKEDDNDDVDLFSMEEDEEENKDSQEDSIDQEEQSDYDENEDEVDLFNIQEDDDDEAEEITDDEEDNIQLNEVKYEDNDFDNDDYDDYDDYDDGSEETDQENNFDFEDEEEDEEDFDLYDIDEEPEYEEVKTENSYVTPLENEINRSEEKAEEISNETNKKIVPNVNSAVNSGGLNTVLTRDKKIVSFVGTTKNGTSFIVNNLALTLSAMNISTAILDTTKTKNAYYIFTKNEQSLRNIAENSITNLSNGDANGIEVNRNLTVYTELPGKSMDDINVENVLTALLEKHDVILIDADFYTNTEFFEKSQEIYLVQSMDILTIQPLTSFLRDLKSKEILKQDKLKIIINKWERVKNLSDRVLIGGISSYNDPAMSYMTELFDKDKILYCKIPFEVTNYVKYINSLVDCEMSLKGYSKQLITSLKDLASMVYPLVNKSTYSPMGNKKERMTFSDSTNDTLNKMKKKY